MKRTASNLDIGGVMLLFATFFLGRWFFFNRSDRELLIPVGVMTVVGLAFLSVGLWNRSKDENDPN